MRIVLDARKYFDFGIGTYIQNLVQHLRSRCSLGLIVSSEDISKIERDPTVELQVNSSGKYSIQELFSVSRDVHRMKADLFHSPHYTVPFNLKVPLVTTIHDILHVKGKTYYSYPKRIYAEAMIAHACRISEAVIVDSEFTKKELLSEFNISGDRVHVIYLGVADDFSRASGEGERKAFRNKYALNKPFILYTGSLKPHKNVPTLIKAYSQLAHRKNYQLVFSGETLSEHKSLVEIIKANNVSEGVVDIGRISRKELAIAYKEASVVVLPSHYEGFGFSILEAMASGTPTIGARAASIPEVIGNAGILFDPFSAEELAQELEKVLTNDNLRTSLIQRGYEQVKRFTWEACASKTFQIYRDLL